MIRKEEIVEISGRLGLTPQVVEKDYALGWFLAGIHQHRSLGTAWVFKGGTCLKKCYFETYRFSEDLDFTVRDGTEAPNSETLKSIFSEVATWIEENSGLEIPRETIEFEVFNNPRGTVSVQGKAAYRGPVRPQVNARSLPRIKIDLTYDEPVLLPVATRRVDHAYSDAPSEPIQVRTYAYEEVFAEKTRALVQRLRPRDLYDVIHLFRRRDLNPDRKLIHQTLSRKCDLRGVAYPTVEAIQSHENRRFVESEWETMLAHQVSTLPPFEQFYDELPQVLDWLKGEAVVTPPPLVIEAEESEVRIEAPAAFIPPAGASILDKIRFAAANRLLLRLSYQGSVREVEPYSLARSSDGNLLLRAIKAPTGDSRSYRFDRMQGAEVTRTPFAPRYEVEITSSGHLPIHQLTRSEPERSSRSRRSASGGPTYVFQCSRCGKQFRRKSQDSTMKEHKDRNGRTCYGGYGRYLRTEY